MQFPLPLFDGYLQELKAMAGDPDGKRDDREGPVETESVAPVESLASSGIVPPAPTKWSSDEAGAQADLPDVPFRFSEKRRLRWSGKTCK